MGNGEDSIFENIGSMAGTGIIVRLWGNIEIPTTPLSNFALMLRFYWLVIGRLEASRGEDESILMFCNKLRSLHSCRGERHRRMERKP